MHQPVSNVKITGAFYTSRKENKIGANSGNVDADIDMKFDASRGGSGLYGDSTTVQPASAQILMIIKV